MEFQRVQVVRVLVVVGVGDGVVEGSVRIIVCSVEVDRPVTSAAVIRPVVILRARQNAGLDGRVGLSVVALDAVGLHGLAPEGVDVGDVAEAMFPIAVALVHDGKKIPIAVFASLVEADGKNLRAVVLGVLGCMVSGSRRAQSIKVPECSMAGTTSSCPTPLGMTPQKSPNQWVKS
jgi:hypothetical protein